MSRLARKLDVLRSEREAIQEEVEANELLGRSVTSRVACVATPAETNKVFLHVAEVDKITALLLALAGRLARAQNALLSLPNEAEAQEKVRGADKCFWPRGGQRLSSSKETNGSMAIIR